MLPSLLLVGCRFFKKENTPTPMPEYIDRNVNIYRKKSVVDKQISLRYFSTMPSVPYISVSAFFNEFFNTELERSVDKREVNGFTYNYLNPYNACLSFDIKNQTLASNKLDSFNSHPDFKENTGKHFVKLDNIESSEISVGTVSLKDYSISIYEDGENAFVPLSLLSSIAGGLQSYNIAYNGKDVYVFDYGGQLGTATRAETFSDTYFMKLKDATESRPDDLISYTYNELRFVFENLRGLTKQLHFGDENLLNLGLDGLLTRDYPKVKEYLLSNDKNKYYEGLSNLFIGLSDGGHTGILLKDECVPAYDESKFKKSESEFEALLNYQEESDADLTSLATSFYLSKWNMLGTDIGQQYYYFFDESEETAIIGFDGFKVDFDAWDNYYNGKGGIPVDTDSYAFVRDKVYQAKRDGAKNLILDLTTNSGGSSYSLEGILALFNHGKGYIKTFDLFNNHSVKENHLIDINLDGKWDDLDKAEAEQFNFNVGVLTSPLSFSCGNLFPYNMKELGYKILGERSGGGSCAVSVNTTADGIPYCHSSYLCLTDGQGENIDGGIAADLEIEKIKYTTIYDCKSFFDISTLSTYLNSAYNA